ncbi:hypothetical protein P3T76_008057 [Phytophthora citrophthora]|uniref:Uncharacterized protein n=1 Tax=Phytophthora citrophthora TaxID=4793 RepID=A0AAD9GME9_9STRA|nr:hypothetical protein P3T76_008057 [Phytophthora citrophthora]
MLIAVFLEYLPRKAVTKRGENTVMVQCSGKGKERATVMLLGDWHRNKYTRYSCSRADLHDGVKFK